MIIGRGMIANRFAEYKDDNILFFASGVSNSNETNPEVFQREETLLKNTLNSNSKKTFIYFSSCDVANPQLNSKQYYQHKLKMEKIVSSSGMNYYIFRLPQIVGKGGNSNNLINFFVNSIKTGTLFEVWEGTKKNIIDIDDVYTIICHLIQSDKYLNRTCNIINITYISILDLVQAIEKATHKKANYISKQINTSFDYDMSCMNSLKKEQVSIFDNNYFEKLILKYYG